MTLGLERALADKKRLDAMVKDLSVIFEAVESLRLNAETRL